MISACAHTAMSNDHHIMARTASTIADAAANAAPSHTSRRVWSAVRADQLPATTIDEETHLKRLTYTVTEAAAILGISRTSADECVRRGEIASLTLGRRVLIAHTALTKLLGEHADNDAIEPR